ncbi:MAG: transglutaminase family protein [Chthoniobacterales bacterium]
MSASKNRAASWNQKTFADHGVSMTLGGEPTYVPVDPVGTEWTFSAVGPTKLGYAEKMANVLLKGPMLGGVVFFSPGKHYPGEVNPRCALRMIKRRDGRSLFAASPGSRPATPDAIQVFCETLIETLGVRGKWLPFTDTETSGSDVRVLPLDHTGDDWVSAKWPLKRRECVLSTAEGQAGLRLPLHLLPEGVPRRALVIEAQSQRLDIFFPPLLQSAFASLASAVGDALKAAKIGKYQLQGYVPQDEAGEWVALGLAADPGVLEINLPVCTGWTDYDFWISEVTTAAEAVGLRSWKTPPGDYPAGTGGGNHLLWGGPTVETNPFFVRPAWLTSILRFWQKHPSLAYVFTGCYVGASSQAPRPDESAKELFDVEMGYHFLESLPEGDHRSLINETLRHLHTDVTGNAHRSEISFDKFWNPGWPGGMLGLIEFRAIESLPRAEWMSAIALLWECIAATCLKKPMKGPLRRFELELHDRYFLPSYLKHDLKLVIAHLHQAGCPLTLDRYEEILSWRFPVLMKFGKADSTLIVRKAHESWPLLCETPTEGGSTSRFVDTSMHRIEFAVSPEFDAQHDIYVHGRQLRLLGEADGMLISGVRYRRSCLYPCMHPGIPPHLPLDVVITKKENLAPVKAFRMSAGDIAFHSCKPPAAIPSNPPCRGMHPRSVTVDLRLQD